MKNLQNNFTTPEQSRRLLELGVPADSADCYHNTIAEKPFVLSMPYSQSNWMYENNPPLPCWSAGRLMEIYDICRCYDGDWDEVDGKETYIETYISAIEDAVLDGMLDFSKLED